MKKIKNHLKEERAKFAQMNFAEKRWYLWEYYKFHIAGVIFVLFLLGSLVNSILNPRPSEYLYIAWDGVSAMEFQLHELAEGLSVIAPDPARQAVFVTDFTTRGIRQHDDAMQMRFVAMLQMGAIDVLITTYDGVRAAVELAEDRRIIRNFDAVFEYFDATDIHDRILFINGQAAAISLYGSPVLDIYGIDSDDVFLCVIANSRRPYEIAKVLEVFLTEVSDDA
ncbi:MAG: hypothetical protein FWC70_00545 [Defluviitaleaceae bacterium]|nr:hypothetical protein [Defluviitaleaceae bacterium]